MQGHERDRLLLKSRLRSKLEQMILLQAFCFLKIVEATAAYSLVAHANLHDNHT